MGVMGMPRVTNFEVLCKNEQPTVSIRTKTSVQNLPVLIGESYGKMDMYLKEIGEYLSDIPYVGYFNMDMQNLDVEIGFPVSKTLLGKGDIKAGCIPAGKVVFCMYRGTYSEITSTYDEMAKWIADKGFKPTGIAYEYYYNSPMDFPESEMLTMLVMPIE
jgi:effector-binding domain-containing protein